MNLISVFEIAGLISFSISGILSGMKRRIDMLGFFVLALITAIGGGIMRDLIIGYIPPAAFRTPLYISVSFGITLFCYLVFRLINPKKHRNLVRYFMRIILISDAIGVGIFTISGTEIARGYYPENSFLCVFVGVLTGVGGGMLRDIFINQIPMIFRKELYATPAILGAVTYIFFVQIMDMQLAMYLCTLIILLIRLASIRFNINLPTIKNKED